MKKRMGTMLSISAIGLIAVNAASLPASQAQVEPAETVVEEIVEPLVEEVDALEPVAIHCRDVYNTYEKVELAGFLFCGLKQAEFRPAGRKQIWLVENEVDRDRYRSAGAAGQTGLPLRKRVFVRVKARLSPARDGGYGTFGIYSHRVILDKIEEMRAANPSDLDAEAPELALN